MKHFDTDPGTESALNARELLIIAPFYGTGNAYPDCAAGLCDRGAQAVRTSEDTGELSVSCPGPYTSSQGSLKLSVQLHLLTWPAKGLAERAQPPSYVQTG